MFWFLVLVDCFVLFCLSLIIIMDNCRKIDRGKWIFIFIFLGLLIIYVFNNNNSKKWHMIPSSRFLLDFSSSLIFNIFSINLYEMTKLHPPVLVRVAPLAPKRSRHLFPPQPVKYSLRSMHAFVPFYYTYQSSCLHKIRDPSIRILLVIYMFLLSTINILLILISKLMSLAFIM